MKSFLFLLSFFFITGVYGQLTEKQVLERALFNLPNVSFTDVSKPGDPFLTMI